jgi:hypothetical protein
MGDVSSVQVPVLRLRTVSGNDFIYSSIWVAGDHHVRKQRSTKHDLERVCWSEDGKSVTIPRLCQFDAVDLGLSLVHPGATITCALLFVTDLFIGSQPLLSMVLLWIRQK